MAKYDAVQCVVEVVARRVVACLLVAGRTEPMEMIAFSFLRRRFKSCSGRGAWSNIAYMAW